MNNSFFHFSRVILFLLLPIIAQAQSVKISPDYPSTIKPGEQFALAVRINKGSATSSARLQLELPAGFDASLVNAKGSDFSFQNNTVKFFWTNLPVAEEFTVSCNLTPTSTLRGKQIITGEFIYGNGDQAEHVLMHACSFNITTGDKTTDANIASPNVERKIITVSEEKGEYKVELTFSPNGVNESAQFTDILPNNFSALIVDAHEASYILENQSVIFTWKRFPSEKSFTISYLVRSSVAGTKPVINGTLVYGDAVEIAAPTMASTYPASKPETTEPARVETEVRTSSMSSAPAPAITAKQEPDITAESTSENQTQSQNTSTETQTPASNTPETAMQSQPSMESTPVVNPDDKQSSQTYAMESDKPENAIPANTASPSSSGIIFRVQISATRNSPSRSSKWFGDRIKISSPVEMTMQEGWKKYLIGSFTEYQEAKSLRNITLDKVNDAFIVAYQNGVRISLSDAIRNKGINP
jgi:hypothetical protein